jgi:hypothetical protein
MKFIQTVDEQFVNTKYITRIYCQKDPVTLKWFIGCRTAHDMGERILDTGLVSEAMAYQQLRDIVRSMGEIVI